MRMEEEKFKHKASIPQYYCKICIYAAKQGFYTVGGAVSIPRAGEKPVIWLVNEKQLRQK